MINIDPEFLRILAEEEDIERKAREARDGLIVQILAEEEDIERKAREARDGLIVQNPKRDAYRHILNLVETLKKSGCHGQTIVQVIEEVCSAQGK